MTGRVIAVDFDGTLCENKFPEIGEPKKYIIDIVKELKRQGNKIILWSCRSGQPLIKAVMWCAEQGLLFDAVNENLPEIIEMYGGDARKVWADIYIDDKNGVIGYNKIFNVRVDVRPLQDILSRSDTEYSYNTERRK